ncbi:juvenile hormone acid O-methyltransferase-like isoform X1 [Dermacentor albipictus]|uniref:juvenile hormone acid O-methyltransferase-like isoform X1 n=1 Tax=Dermacentor albipictus TaxID=60249 RepID=UPI0031FCABA3
MAGFQEHSLQAVPVLPHEQERVDFYDVNSQGHFGVVAGLLGTFHKAFRPCEDEDQQFLDIGCGPGRLTAECLFPRCPACRRLVAVDKSTAMLKFAAENYPHPKIDYLALDIAQEVDEFVREQGQFQRVYSFLTLHWVRDQPRAMQNIERLMAPGGECILLFKRSVHFFDLFEAMINTQQWSKYREVLESMMPASRMINDVLSLRAYARNIVESTSLTTLSCEVLVSPEELRWTRGQMTESLLAFNPVYPLLVKEEKEELQNFIRGFVNTFSIDFFNRDPANRMYVFIHACKQFSEGDTTNCSTGSS